MGIEAPNSVYSQRLLEHFKNPRNTGELSPPAASVEVENPACGDILRLSVRFDGSVVREARYRARGCAASIACGSALTEWLVGKSRAEMAGLDAAALEQVVGGLAPEARHAAALCVTGVRDILKSTAPAPDHRQETARR